MTAKVTKSIDTEGFPVVTTVEVLPKIETSYVNGVRLTKHTYKDGATTIQADCHCMGSTMSTHSRADCPNRLAILARRRGNR